MPVIRQAGGGVVGLGHMGTGFARNLIAEGHRVVAYDRDAACVAVVRSACLYQELHPHVSPRMKSSPTAEAFLSRPCRRSARARCILVERRLKEQRSTPCLSISLSALRSPSTTRPSPSSRVSATYSPKVTASAGHRLGKDADRMRISCRQLWAHRSNEGELEWISISAASRIR
jgi:hypothetical protein